MSTYNRSRFQHKKVSDTAQLKQHINFSVKAQDFIRKRGGSTLQTANQHGHLNTSMDSTKDASLMENSFMGPSRMGACDTLMPI